MEDERGPDEMPVWTSQLEECIQTFVEERGVASFDEIVAHCGHLIPDEDAEWVGMMMPDEG
jgi:hypothetical protein